LSVNTTPPDPLTVNEVAAEFRVNKKTVLGLIHDGTLPASKLGRVYRIRRADLDALRSAR
jgi:excisionase family DNA binding protein